MLWQIILGVLLAGFGLTALTLFLTRFLFPLPLDGLYVLSPSAAQVQFLEQQLRGMCWLRQMGLFRGRILVVSDGLTPGQALFLQTLARQNLVDEILPLAQLGEQMNPQEE